MKKCQVRFILVTIIFTFLAGFMTTQKLQWQTYEGVILSESTWSPLMIRICEKGKDVKYLNVDFPIDYFCNQTPESIRAGIVLTIKEQIRHDFPTQKIDDKNVFMRSMVKLQNNKKICDNDDLPYACIDLSLEVFNKTLPGDKLIFTSHQLVRKKDDIASLHSSPNSSITIIPIKVPSQFIVDSKKYSTMWDRQLNKYYDYLGPISRDDENFPKVIGLWQCGADLILTTVPEEVVYRWNDFEEGAMTENTREWIAYLQLLKDLHPKKPRNITAPPHIDYYEYEDYHRIHQTANYYLYVSKFYRKICGYKPYYIGDFSLSDKIQKIALEESRN
ncbi:MAG: hypothetical protein ACD_58C00287G0015 [uncultured bacterium]|nr:MAG: hypothetical protein ACD_58C00287G0015 [uncultured bacterium]